MFQAIQPPMKMSVAETLAAVYFDIYDARFLDQAINELMAEAKAQGVPFKKPKKLLPKRPMKTEHLQMLWKHLGYDFTDIECEEQCAASDNRGEETLEFPSFCEIFSSVLAPEKQAQDLLDAFKELDPQGRGFVTTDEFTFSMTKLVQKVDKKRTGFPPMEQEMLAQVFGVAGADPEMNPNIKYEELARKISEAINSDGKKKKGKKGKKKK